MKWILEIIAIFMVIMTFIDMSCKLWDRFKKGKKNG